MPVSHTQAVLFSDELKEKLQSEIERMGVNVGISAIQIGKYLGIVQQDGCDNFYHYVLSDWEENCKEIEDSYFEELEKDSFIEWDEFFHAVGMDEPDIFPDSLEGEPLEDILMLAGFPFEIDWNLRRYGSGEGVQLSMFPCLSEFERFVKNGCKLPESTEEFPHKCCVCEGIGRVIESLNEESHAPHYVDCEHCEGRGYVECLHHRKDFPSLVSAIITPKTHPDHAVVGKLWISTWAGKGIVYLCDSYDPKLGYWMTPAEGSPAVNGFGFPVERVNVSERAIGRTYHRHYLPGELE
jgi:hypothetical protein